MNDVNSAEKAILARLATEETVATAPIVDLRLDEIAIRLEAIRQQLCPYPTNGSSCDCKYGLGYGVSLGRSEKTGCPELREIIAVYRRAARGFPVS